MNLRVKIISISLALGTYATLSNGGTISQTPLFVATQVAPNVFFELDDSGSMDWTVLSKKYWSPRVYDPDSGDDNNSSTDPTGTFDTAPITTGNLYSFGMKP
jgi:type IV pilus assembly protein PilY1